MEERNYPNILAVIPARSGSKGIPKKNLKVIMGKSLLARAIITASKVPFVTDIVVSTDGKEEAEEALKYGAKIPFMRPEELSSDTARAHETWGHAWLETEKALGKKYEISIFLEPTSPMRMASDIIDVVNELINNGSGAAASFSRTPAHYTPEKTLYLDENGRINFYTERGHNHAYRQSLPKYYYRNGLCYAVRRDTLLKDNHIIEKDCVGVIAEREIVNIDDPIDIEFTEFLMKKYGDPLQPA